MPDVNDSPVIRLEMTDLGRPPVPESSGGVMAGRQVVGTATAGPSALPCMDGAATAENLSEHGIGNRVVSRPGRLVKGRGVVPSDAKITGLLVEAIESRPGKKAVVREIYEFLQDRHPGVFSARNKRQWQSRVRRILSKKEQIFTKARGRSPYSGISYVDKGNYWRLARAQPIIAVRSSGSVSASNVSLTTNPQELSRP